MGIIRNAVCTIAGLLLVSILVNAARTNCGVGSTCDICGANFKLLKVGTRFLKVCCGQTCSKYFQAGYFNQTSQLRPYCTCNEERVKGDCWKGAQCNACNNGYTGYINGLPVCCPNCEKSGKAMSPTYCFCLHNGK